MKSRSLYAIVTLVLALCLGACGSRVKLNEVAVEDRNVSGASAAQSGAAGSDRAAESSAGGAGAGAALAPAALAGANVAASDLTARKGPAPVPADLAMVIYFEYDSFEIKAQFQPTVQAHARYLSANKERKLVLEGHTDERGGREYNLALGQKRAESVSRALSVLGVAGAQVESVSFGQEKPAVAGSDEAAYQKNRRVEFSYR